MKIPALTFCILFLIACNSNKNAAKDNIAKLKAAHTAKIERMRTIPEPFIQRVPDSMKKWIPILRDVLADDQKIRMAGVIHYTKEEWNEQAALDSQNLKIVTSYLDRYGWPVIFDVGLIGQKAIGLIIQHSPLQIQEKYYPYLIKAYKRDTLLFETLALLEDRINMRNHRYQYYGSQVVPYKGKQTLYPVLNIDKIDSTRKRIGIKMPIGEYLKILNVEWDVTAYKQLLPALIKEFKVSDSSGIHFERQ